MFPTHNFMIHLTLMHKCHFIINQKYEITKLLQNLKNRISFLWSDLLESKPIKIHKMQESKNMVCGWINMDVYGIFSIFTDFFLWRIWNPSRWILDNAKLGSTEKYGRKSVSAMNVSFIVDIGDWLPTVFVFAPWRTGNP